MENKDNQIGFALALSSSAFIGSSFIIKKKGLIKSRRAGGAASDGGHAYLYEYLWWLGLLTMVGGEIANFAAYAFAPAILVTPLGALSVIFSAVLADRLLNEKLLNLGKVGCALCILGSTVIVVNAPEEKQVESVEEITDEIFSNIPFQLYAICVILSSLYLIYAVAPKSGKRNIFVYVTICSIVGSLSVIGVKGLGIALKLTFSGNNQLIYGSFWGFVVLVAVSVVIQMNYLNMALDTFNTAMVTPIYYVLFTTATIVASALLFRGWSSGDACNTRVWQPDTYNGPTLEPVVTSPGDALVMSANCTDGYGAGPLLTCLCGFLTICLGVYLLHQSREQAAQNAAAEADDAFAVGSPRGSRNIIALTSFGMGLSYFLVVVLTMMSDEETVVDDYDDKDTVPLMT